MRDVSLYINNKFILSTAAVCMISENISEYIMINRLLKKEKIIETIEKKLKRFVSA